MKPLAWRISKKCIKFRSWKLKLYLLCCLTVWMSLITFIWMDKPKSNGQRSSCSVLTRSSSFSNESQCNPLQPIELLSTSDITEVKGKYMEDTDETRPLMEFLIRPRDLLTNLGNCTAGVKIKWNLVFVVKSSISNKERRAAIRATWGAVKLLNLIRLEVVFIVGLSSDSETQKEISKESEKYGDILQMNLEDSAKTVPQKVLAGMQWAHQNLPPHWIYASVDDDIVVHVENLVNYFETLLQPIKTADTNQAMRPCYEDLPIVCVYSYQDEDAPSRNIFGKWYISYEEFPDKIWPKYCRGGLYVMPVKMVQRLHKVSRKTKYLYLDDVWITGFMRRKLYNQDCNIMPAPYSIKANLELEFNIGYNENTSLMKHLWGNIYFFFNVNVEEMMVATWNKWKTFSRVNGYCLES